MRKYLCVLISIILCLTVFCACSNGKAPNVAGSTNITSSTSSEQTTDTEEVTVTANEVQTTQKTDKKTTKFIKKFKKMNEFYFLTLRAKSRKQLCKKRMTIRLLKPPRLRLIAQSLLNVSQFSIIWTT